jgi:osmotically-inducible protein OsmY
MYCQQSQKWARAKIKSKSSYKEELLTQLLPLMLAVFAAVILILTPDVSAREDLPEEKIISAIESELFIDPAVSSHLVDVELNNGVVTLSGTIDNILAKERAEKLTETVRGVTAIINKINVEPVEKSDTQLRADIMSALLKNPVTESYELQARVNNSVVTLSGSVESWAEKQLAEKVAKSVSGVKEVVDNINVTYAYERPENEIKKEVQARLSNDAYVDEGLIEVEVNDDVVELSGAVGSLAEKHRAYSDSWVQGVDSVLIDNLDVRWWARDQMQRNDKYIDRPDSQVEKNAEKALLYDPRVNSFDIDVQVIDSTATLTGKVSTLDAKKAAENDVENTIGLWRVVNKIKVRMPKLYKNIQLEMELEDSLRNDPFVERYEITVTVRNQKAYLYGKVDSMFDKQRASEIAAGIPGIIAIENNIEVKEQPWTWKPDQEIKENVQDQLFWSPYVDSDLITVSVDGGIVTLSGTVDSMAEHQAAVDNAFQGGARAVRSNMAVMETRQVDDYPESTYYSTYSGYPAYPAYPMGWGVYGYGSGPVPGPVAPGINNQ